MIKQFPTLQVQNIYEQTFVMNQKLRPIFQENCIKNVNTDYLHWNFGIK